MKDVRLTQMVTSAGCAAKLFPFLLSDVLNGVEFFNDKNVIVGFEGKDDAGVYKLNEELALIATTDFFTPVVDDPYTYGQIAVTNSLSDVYAMGGIPKFALNIVAFPQTEDLEILKEILRGGSDKAKEAECSIIGGHSVDIKNILYGLAVTGIVQLQNLKTNDNAQEGDILILTKSLGTGLLNNAVKYSILQENHYQSLINSMSRLNKNASEIMIKYKANACTDVTGFGLAGHSMQMAIASKKVLHFNMKNLPVLEGAFDAIEKKLLTRADKSNRIYTAKNIQTVGKVNINLEHIFYDPQTSGGLLISIPEKFANAALQELKEKGDLNSSIVGWVETPDNHYTEGTVVLHYE